MQKEFNWEQRLTLFVVSLRGIFSQADYAMKYNAARKKEGTADYFRGKRNIAEMIIRELNLIIQQSYQHEKRQKRSDILLNALQKIADKYKSEEPVTGILSICEGAIKEYNDKVKPAKQVKQRCAHKG